MWLLIIILTTTPYPDASRVITMDSVEFRDSQSCADAINILSDKISEQTKDTGVKALLMECVHK